MAIISILYVYISSRVVLQQHLQPFFSPNIFPFNRERKEKKSGKYINGKETLDAIVPPFKRRHTGNVCWIKTTSSYTCCDGLIRAKEKRERDHRESDMWLFQLILMFFSFLCVSGDINQPAGVSPSCVSHHFVSVTRSHPRGKKTILGFFSWFYFHLLPPPFIVDFVASKK